MFRLTVRSFRANKIRFALTTFGVVLAVSFVVGAFVLGDGLRRSFTDVSTEITAGIDLEVRGVADFGDVPPLPMATVPTVARVDGVADAVAVIEGAENAVRPVRADGTVVPTKGPPILAFNWIDNPALSAFTLVDGAAPAVGQFTMDVDAAAKNGFVVGDTYELLTPNGRVHLTMSGTSKFGSHNSTLGAVLLQVNTAQASDLFGIDGITSVAVQLRDGADAGAVRAAVAAAVPSAEVVDGATVRDETAKGFTDQIDLVGNILLGFGGVAVFVSMFIIYNTFGILLAQRSRELALLRTLGASPRQVRRMALGEALSVGALASLGGIGGGVLVAKGIDALFGLMGMDLVDYPLILARRTLVTAVVIGVGVTLLAAWGPARRAASVSPMTILNGTQAGAGGGSRVRAIWGSVLFGTGLLAFVAGIGEVGPASLTAVALAGGAVAMFAGVVVLSPLAVGAVTRLVGWPMRRLGGVAGRLAQKNAARNSRRTATTAVALMIGLAVVSTALVVGSSVKATIGSAFEDSAKAEYYLSDDLDEVDFPASLAGDLRGSPAIDAATGFTPVTARVDGNLADTVAFDFDQIEAVIDLGVRDGSFTTPTARAVAVSVDTAHDLGIAVGDVVNFEFANGSRADTTVVALFSDQAIMSEDYLLDTSVLSSAGVTAGPAWLAVSTADGASPDDVDALFAAVTRELPQTVVETRQQFRQRMEDVVDVILTMVNAMVALAVVIALIGIANTLALSVVERTRELGLVRAVGMTRRQVRRMVRFEAVLVAVFGAALGAGLGLLFGVGVVGTLPSRLASGVTLPVVPILVMVLVAGIAGMAAAWLPARRAGRLDVLAAIAVAG